METTPDDQETPAVTLQTLLEQRAATDEFLASNRTATGFVLPVTPENLSEIRALGAYLREHGTWTPVDENNQ